jgi:hypothetical protein
MERSRLTSRTSESKKYAVFPSSLAKCAASHTCLANLLFSVLRKQSLVHIPNLDAPSNMHRKPEAFLLSHEREKKKKYLQACPDQRRHFSPIVVPCNRVLGKEAKVVQYYKTLQEVWPIN